MQRAGATSSDTQTVVAQSPLVAFVGTAKPEAALAFYRDVLGLRLVDRHEFALVFDANGTTLRVAIAAEVKPLPYTVLGWQVPDATAACDELAGRGVEFVRCPGFAQDERGIWTAPSGAHIGWFRDPDGNLLSIND